MKFKAKEIFAGHDENEILLIGCSGGTTEHNGQIYFMIPDANE